MRAFGKIHCHESRQPFRVDFLPLFGELGVDLHDHGGVLVAHPGLQRLDGDFRLIRPGAEVNAEVMAANFDLSPWRQLLTPGRQRLVRFGLAVLALVAADDLRFQKAQIGAEPVLECAFGHQPAVLLGTEQAR